MCMRVQRIESITIMEHKSLGKQKALISLLRVVLMVNMAIN